MKARRITSLLLAAVLVLGAFGTLPITALEADNPADRLVVHYDFLGSTLAEQLSDKAPVGDSKENLTLTNKAGLSKIEGGVAYIDAAKDNALGFTAAGTDLTGASEITLVTRFKYDGENPYSLVDIINIPGVIRVGLQADATIAAWCYYNGGTSQYIALGGGTKYAAGQWIDLALTLSYSGGSLKAARYVSADGWRTNAKYEPAAETGVNANPLASVTSMTLGKNNTGMYDRGRSFAFDDFRIYNTVLTLDEIKVLDVETTDAGVLDNSMIAHYDFNGESSAEQLRDKGTAGHIAENLTLAGDDSYIKNGYAYISSKQSNYLSTNITGDVKSLTKAISIFVEYQAETTPVSEPNQVDMVMIPGTTRIAMRQNGTPVVMSSKNGSWIGPGVNTPVQMGIGDGLGWNKLAYILEPAANGGHTLSLYSYSASTGVWTSASYTFSSGDLNQLFTGANQILFGKASAGIADRGINLCYNDIRIYDKALTLSEVKTITTESYGNFEDTLRLHYDFSGADVTAQLTDKVADRTFNITRPAGAALTSSIANGVVNLNSASGESLWLGTSQGYLPSEVKGADGSMTLYTAFKITGQASAEGVYNELLTVSNTLRLAFQDTTASEKLVWIVGNGASNVDVTAYNANRWVAEELATAGGGTKAASLYNKEVRLAVVLTESGGYVTVRTHISTDDGATWYDCGAFSVQTTLNTNSGFLIVGNKLTNTVNPGYNYAIDDLRIYSSALTLDQIKSIVINDSPELSGTAFTPDLDYSLHYDIPWRIVEQYDSMNATVTCLDKTVTLEGKKLIGSNGVPVMRFTYSELSALTLEENVTLTVNAVYRGRTTNGKSVTTTVKRECERILASSTATDKLKKTCVMLLEYGAAAQTYFDYRTDALVNRDLTEDQRAICEGTELTLTACTNMQVATVASPTAVFCNATVNLRNPLEMRFAFQTNEEYSKLVVVVRDSENRTVLNTVPSSDLQTRADGSVEFGYTAATMRQQVCLTVYKDWNGSAGTAVSNTMRYSVESFAALKANDSNAKLSALVVAMMFYNDALTDGHWLLTYGNAAHYTIYTRFSSAIDKAYALQLQAALKALSGIELPLKNADTETPAGKCILVGKTGHATADAYLSTLGAKNFAFRVTDGGLIIVGATSDEQYYKLDLSGIVGQYFTLDGRGNLQVDADLNIQKNTTYSAGFGTSVTVDDSFVLVYDADADPETETDGGLTPAEAAQKYADYIYKETGVRFAIAPDTGSYAKEIWFGRVNRPGVAEAHAKLVEDNEYYVAPISSSAIMVLGQDVGGQFMAARQLIDMFKRAGTTAVTVRTSDTILSTRMEVPYTQQNMNGFIKTYQSMFGTVSSYIDVWKGNLPDEAAKQDAIKALMTKLGNGVVFNNESTTAIHKGFHVKLDPTDYSKYAKRSGGNLLIPGPFATVLFGSGLTLDTNGYFNVTSYCSSNSAWTLTWDSTNCCAFLLPTGMSLTDADKASLHQLICDYYYVRQPDNDTEQTRVVIKGLEYTNADVFDSTKHSYMTTYSPSVCATVEGGKEVLYASYDMCRVTNFASEVGNIAYMMRSTDGGQTWVQVGEVPGMRWASLFEMDDDVYLLGTHVDTNRAMVAKYDPDAAKFEWAQLSFIGGAGAPCSILIANGRIYKASGCIVMSASVTSNLLLSASWTMGGRANEYTDADGNILGGYLNVDWFIDNAYALDGTVIDETKLTGTPKVGYGEGSMVQGIDGKVYMVLRVDCAPYYNYAVIVEVSADGKTVSAPTTVNGVPCQNGLIKMPTNPSKFSVRYDATTGLYYAMTSVNTLDGTTGYPDERQRNTLVLIASKDLVNWVEIDTLLVDREVMNPTFSAIAHAYQYVDFVISGDNMYLAVREASGETNSYHDGKFVTFYTLKNFRELVSEKAPSLYAG